MACSATDPAATITAAAGTTPSITLDYGKDVGGVPEFGISARTGAPTMKAGYAEALRFLTPNGDGGRPFESGDASRGDSYAISTTGLLSNKFIQGGERYQQITLTSPGVRGRLRQLLHFRPGRTTSPILRASPISKHPASTSAR